MSSSVGPLLQAIGAPPALRRVGEAAASVAKLGELRLRDDAELGVSRKCTRFASGNASAFAKSLNRTAPTGNSVRSNASANSRFPLVVTNTACAKTNGNSLRRLPT